MPTAGVSSGLYGQGYTTQRPSSAGYNRPSSSTPVSTAQYPNVNQINITGPPVSATYAPNSQSSSRPRSAGAVRRVDPNSNTNAPINPASNNVYTYIPQAYNIYSNPFGQTQQRPMSANATAYTTTPHGGLATQWDSYKQYTQTPIQQLATQQQQQPTQPQSVGYGKIPIAQPMQQQPQVQYVQQQPPSMQRPQSAGSVSNKLRKAVDLSRNDDGNTAAQNDMRGAGGK